MKGNEFARMLLQIRESQEVSELATRFAQECGMEDLRLLLHESKALTAAAQHQQALHIAEFCRLTAQKRYDEPIDELWVDIRKLEAEIHRRLLDFWRALDIYQQLISEVPDDENLRAALLAECGRTCREMGDLELSIDYLGKAVVLFQAGGNQREMAKCHRELGVVSQDAGYTSQSWSFYQQALGLAATLELHSLEADVLRRMAFLSIKLGNPQDGIEYASRALKICESHNLSKNRADTLAVLGNIYHETGNFQRALGCLVEAVDLAQQIEYSRREATALGDLGEIYRLLNDNETARRFLQEALAAAEKVGHPKAVCSYLARLAWIYRDEGDYEAALESLLQALVVGDQLGLQLERAEFLAAIGNLHLRKGEFDFAQDYLEEALDLGSTFSYSRVVADALRYLGSVYVAKDADSEAYSYFQRALAEAEKAGLSDVIYLIHLALGKFCQERGRTADAIVEYEEAIEVVESMRQGIRLEESKMSFVLDKMEPYRALVIVNHALSSEAIALHYVERMKSRAFLDLLAITEIQPWRAIPLTWLEQEDALVSGIRTLGGQKGSTSAAEEQLEQMEIELDSLWAGMAGVDPEYVSMRQSEPLSYLGIKSLLVRSG